MQITYFIYTVILHVAVWLQCTAQNYSTKGLPYNILFIGLRPYVFHKIVYFYSTHLFGIYVSATSTCCDANITEYKRSTGVHTLPNTLLIVEN